MECFCGHTTKNLSTLARSLLPMFLHYWQKPMHTTNQAISMYKAQIQLACNRHAHAREHQWQAKLLVHACVWNPQHTLNKQVREKPCCSDKHLAVGTN